MTEEAGIYIHIPFCRRFCYYCNFTKLRFNTGVEKVYTDYLIKELNLKESSSYSISSIYFGGGSPSLFTASAFNSIIKFIKEKFHVTNDCEITIEMNPEDVSEKELLRLRRAGINRLSLGVQSFNEKDLLFLERRHNPEISKSAVEGAKRSGFSNINLDFIIGLPGQNKERLKENYGIAAGYDIPHISSYILEGVREKNRDIPDDKKQTELYGISVNILDSFGYRQYEVSNFCRENIRSVHNMKYWTGKSYIGVGISSSGFERGTDYKNFSDLKQYYLLLNKGEFPVEKTEHIDSATRRIITGLRLREGIEEEFLSKKKREVDLLISENILKKHRGNISVSPDKLCVLNEVLLHLI